MMRQGQKELQSDKPAGPLYGCAVRVNDPICFSRHDRSRSAKRSGNGVRMQAEKHPGSHGHREPLVRVTRDGVRVADSGEMAAEARGDDGGPSPCCIDVKPELLRAA